MVVLDILLIVLGSICLLLGVIGCFLPLLPGPPIAYVGLLLLHFTKCVQFTPSQLWSWFFLMLATVLIDLLLPLLGVKKWKGTKWGNRGCMIGILFGLFLFPPWGIILGPFVGAVLGELLLGRTTSHVALKSGFGALVGFLLGVVLKVTVCLWFIFCFVYAFF